MERGANTFPFHNLLPYSESNEGLFLFFSPSLNWIKEKSVATLGICTFAIEKSQSQFTVLQIAFTLAGSTSIPLPLTTNLRSLPDLTPKVHLLGLSLSLYFFSLSNSFCK